MQYFPDKMPADRWADRTYFFNVLNSVDNEYLQRLIAHANKMRHSAESAAKQDDNVEITQEWWDKLHAVPFVSGKFKSPCNLL